MSPPHEPLKNPLDLALPLPGAGSAGDPAAVMTLRGVEFGYEPGRPVVRSVTAQLAAGRVCALIGPNAAGKSTLLKLMLGQLQAWRGEVELSGQPVAALSMRARAGLVSFVPQRSSASFAFSVEQVVAMGRYALPPSDSAVESALADCDLSALRGRVFAELSVGQQQRVLMARAMAQSAEGGRVMLLDEPGSGMDLWHVHQTMRQLARLAARGLAVLVVMHDLNLCARYADEVWLMDEGKLVASGSWQTVLTPAVLEPIYRVKLTAVAREGEGRPVFLVDPE